MILISLHVKIIVIILLSLHLNEMTNNNAIMLHAMLVTAQNFNEAMLVHKQVFTISATLENLLNLVPFN